MSASRTPNGRLSGVIAAIPTPFDAAGRPDAGLFAAFATRLLDGGCDALNVLGTTGEATSIGIEDRMALMTAAAKALPVERLMVGTGTTAVADTIRLTRHAAELGYAGALILPPFYYKGVADAGIVAGFEAVAAATQATPIPLYLYNFPAMTGIVYTRALVAALAERLPERIRGLKDSSGDMAYAAEIAAIGGIDVFPSNEASLIEARGGAFAGCISATANLSAALCARAWRDGDAAALDKAVAIRKRVSAGPLVPGVKAVAAALAGADGYRRTLPPLIELDAAAAAALAREVQALS